MYIMYVRRAQLDSGMRLFTQSTSSILGKRLASPAMSANPLHGLDQDGAREF
jgi:hypothetical protein